MRSMFPIKIHFVFLDSLQLGRKSARHDHLTWSENPPILRELHSLFPKQVIGMKCGVYSNTVALAEAAILKNRLDLILLYFGAI
uniref:SFRICE_013938 n=1 Tax=Spodoptera frugiperda TaxID=7108 RepID=A0A2H1VTW4_SPOFR